MDELTRDFPYELEGNLKYIETIDHGAFGTVIHVIEISSNKDMAIKVINKVGQKVSLINKMKEEISILRKLNHENIVKFFGFFETNNQLLIKMEYIKYGTLSHWIKNHNKISEEEASIILKHVLSAVIKFWIQMILVIIIVVYYVIKGEVHPHWGAWPLILVVLIHLGLLGMGLGIIISSMTTKYRDLSVLVGFGVQLLMYATPVVYPLSQLGEGWLKKIMMINPITSSMEILRYAVLGKGTIVPLYIAISWAIALLVVVIGIMIFNRVEKTFMDTV